MRLKPASALRSFYDAITTERYRKTIIQPECVLDEEYLEDTKEFLNLWKAVCKPYQHVLAMFRDSIGEKLQDLSRSDSQLINELSGLSRDEIDESLAQLQSKLGELTQEVNKGKLLDVICSLFQEPWFTDLMKGILKENKVDATVEDLFSGGNRTYANKNSLCGCDLLHQPAHKRGCEKCDPLHVLFSSEVIRIHRNGEEHMESWKRNDSLSKGTRQKIRESFKHRQETLVKIHPLEHQKILATILHVFGMNDLVWEIPPESVRDIWQNYPTEDPLQLMKNTIQKLLSNNNKWGVKYIDNNGRKDQLKQELRGTKIVTIHGEGGFGKTELVYQTLKNSLEDENQTLRFDELLPFTFKGTKQGEYSVESPDYRTDANQEGWEPIGKIQQMVRDIGKKLDDARSKNLDKTEIDTWYKLAVEYLVSNNVWLIIDNHEIDKKEEDLTRLLNEFLQHPDIQQNNSRIIITTRVTPPPSRPGTKIKIMPLSPLEMRQLAQSIAIWRFQQDKDENIGFPLDYYNNEDVWKKAAAFIQPKLKSKRHATAAGHPYVVDIAVFKHMFRNPEKKNFEIFLEDIINKYVDGTDDDDDAVVSLMTYTIGESFNYMETCKTPEDGEKHLNLTQYQQITTDDLIENYGENWFEYHRELTNLGILIETDYDDEFEFKTEHHRNQLRDFVSDTFEIQHPSLKWRWWKDRMDAVKLDKKLKVTSLRKLGVADDATETHQQDRLGAFKLLAEYENWTIDDVHACINITKHFGMVLSQISDRNQFLLTPAQSRSDYRLNLVQFLYDTVALGLESLAEYLAISSGSVHTLDMFERVLHFVDRVYMEGGVFIKGDTEHFPALDHLEQEQSKLIETGRISKHLNHVLRQLLKNVPIPTKDSLDSIQKLWRLGKDKASDGTVSPNELIKTGLCQVSLAGYTESLNIVHYLAEHGTINNADGKPIQATEHELGQTGAFLCQFRHLIKHDPLIPKFIEMVKSNIWHQEHESVGVPLFVEEEVHLKVELQATGTIVGKDKNPAMDEISHHITIRSQLHLPLQSQTIKAKVTRFAVEGNIHYSILEEITKIEDKPNQMQTSVGTGSLKSVEEVSPKEMRRILRSIEFDLTIPGSVVFGVKLKEKLEEEGIEHHNKVWRRWKKAHFPSNERNGYEKLADIIPKLMNNQWKVEEAEEGMDIRIRKVAQRLPKYPLPDANTERLRYKPQVEEEDYHHGRWGTRADVVDGSFSLPRKGRRAYEKRSKKPKRGGRHPACQSCRSRIHLNRVSHDALWCSQCDVAIDSLSGAVLSGY